jgi:hypothetical protein
MQHEAERERLTRNIEDDRTEVWRAMRDLGLSVLFGLNLPRRIRRRPVPWTIGALGLAAFVIFRRQQRKRTQRWSQW